MVTDPVVVKKKFNFWKFIGCLVIIGLIVAIGIGIYYLGVIFGSGPTESSYSYDNPVTPLLEAFIASGAVYDEGTVISQAELEFDQEYINYVLV